MSPLQWIGCVRVSLSLRQEYRTRLDVEMGIACGT